MLDQGHSVGFTSRLPDLEPLDRQTDRAQRGSPVGLYGKVTPLVHTAGALYRSSPAERSEIAPPA